MNTSLTWLAGLALGFWIAALAAIAAEGSGVVVVAGFVGALAALMRLLFLADAIAAAHETAKETGPLTEESFT